MAFVKMLKVDASKRRIPLSKSKILPRETHTIYITLFGECFVSLRSSGDVYVCTNKRYKKTQWWLAVEDMREWTDLMLCARQL
jgi:hypothetical protein